MKIIKMTEQPRYVDPTDIINPNAEPLSDEELKMQLQDSFRLGRQFIKTAEDPVLPTIPDQYLALIKVLDDETQGKYTPLFDKLRQHFDKRERPLEAICFHLLEKPVMIKGTDGKEYPQFGWAKMRGEFATFGEMEQEIQVVMKDIDTYTRTIAYPKGAFFPITMAPLGKREDIEKVYDADMKRVDGMKQQIIEMERKREQALIKMQEDTEPGSLEDYIRQKIRLCTAETKIQRANLDLKKFNPILERQSSIVAKMETEHPNYFKEGLVLYQQKMEEIGFPKPGSFYDGCISTGFGNS